MALVSTERTSLVITGGVWHTVGLSSGRRCPECSLETVMAYAIIEDSGTQLKVEPGDRFEIDLRDLKDGQTTVTFDKVLLVSGDAGVKIGQPTVAGATVTAK